MELIGVSFWHFFNLFWFSCHEFKKKTQHIMDFCNTEDVGYQFQEEKKVYSCYKDKCPTLLKVQNNFAGHS